MEAPLITPRMMRSLNLKENQARFKNASKKKKSREEEIEKLKIVAKKLFYENRKNRMKLSLSRMIR